MNLIYLLFLCLEEVIKGLQVCYLPGERLLAEILVNELQTINDHFPYFTFVFSREIKSI